MSQPGGGISQDDLQAAGIAPMLARAMPQQSQAPSIDPAALAALSSDPNGFVPSPDDLVAQAKKGIPASDLPITESMSPDQVGYPVGQASPQSTAGTGPNSASQAPFPADQSSAPVSAPPPQNVAIAAGFPQFSDWAKASGLPRQVMPDTAKMIMEKYLDQQKEFMARQDPEKILKLQQLQHEISTQRMKDQNLQAQTAESQSKVIAGELAKQQAQDTVSNQIADLQTQKENLQAIANHPELKHMTGAAWQYNPGYNNAQRDLAARLEQVSGQQLIGGINKIKDEAANPNGTLGMRITQQEALAVKNAVQRLQRYQDPATFASSANEAAGFLDRAIAAKQAQLSRMPSVNQDLLKQFSYSASASATGNQSAAPVIKTIPRKGTFRSLGNGQWEQIQ